LSLSLHISRMYTVLEISSNTEKARENISGTKNCAVVREEPDPNIHMTTNQRCIEGQFCPNYMEDKATCKTFDDKKWGRGLISMVADGHAGSDVSTMLKNNVLKKFSRHFRNQNHESISINLKNLDHIMISVIRNINLDLQKDIVEKDLQGGSTLVTVFAFLDYQRLYILNVGDSRFMMFETETGNIVHTVSRIIDLQDGMDRFFSEEPHPSCTELHKVLGKIKIANRDPKLKKQLKEKESQPGQWSRDFLSHVKMENETIENRGIREWALFLENEETNPDRSLKLVHHRRGDKNTLVIGKNGRLGITRCFGDIGIAMHLGEIYIADIPTDREVAFLLCSDGLEESIDHQLMTKYICHPENEIQNLFFQDHQFRKMSEEYKKFFIKKDIGEFPENEDILAQINWFERCLEIIGESHLPNGKRDRAVIATGAQWMKWAYNNKFSSLSHEHPANKFHQNFHESVSFRLQFLIQCALCRLSFDNISGILVSIKPEELSSN